MITETELWVWFVFGGQLPPLHAKMLLERWTNEGRTLESSLAHLAQNPEILKLSRDEAAKLKLPPPEMAGRISALRLVLG